MAYEEFRGIFLEELRHEENRIAGRQSRHSVFLGWQDDEKVLWIVPTNSTMRNPHFTGSSRSRPIPADKIRDIWVVPDRRLSRFNAVDLEVDGYRGVHGSSSGTVWHRFSEKKAQGRLGDVIDQLRAATR